jgi:polysaccharide biosynthesis protein PslG
LILMRFGLLGFLIGALLLPARGAVDQTSSSLPSIARLVIDLSGQWDFCIDSSIAPASALSETSIPARTARTPISVPGTWESAGQVRPNPGWPSWEPYNGVAWYQRTVAIPTDWRGLDAELCIGAVQDRARAFWNGNLIGEAGPGNQDTRLRIPAAILSAGSTCTLSVRVVNERGPGGITGPDVTIRVLSPYDGIAVVVGFPEPSAAVAEAARKPEIPGVTAHTDSLVQVRIGNGTAVPVSGTLTLDLKRETGVSASACPDQVSSVGPGSTATVTLHLPDLGRGWYRSLAELRFGGGPTLSGYSSFAVIDAPGIVTARVEECPFGVNHRASTFLATLPPVGSPDPELARLSGTGAAWGRELFWWDSAVPVAKERDWRASDHVVQLYASHGIEMLATICGSWDTSTSGNEQAKILEFTSYVEQIATRYRGKVRHWEIWNEPNRLESWRPPDAGQYDRLLAAASLVLKRVDRENRVIAFATSGTDLEFIRKAIAAGASRAFDIVSVHAFQELPPWETEDPASGKPTQFENLRSLRHLLDQHGRHDAQVWITECGFPTVGSVSPLDQARLLVQSMSWLLVEGMATRIFWSQLQDIDAAGDAPGRRSGLCFSDGSPKPSYLAYRTLVEQISGFTSASRVESAPGSDRLMFHTPRATVEIVWARNSDLDVPVLPYQTVQDVFGRPVKKTGGLLSVGRMPVYLISPPTGSSARQTRELGIHTADSSATAQMD